MTNAFTRRTLIAALAAGSIAAASGLPNAAFAQTPKEIRIDFANADPDSVEDFSWDDTRFWSIGAEYKLSDAFTIRGGYAYDETPTTFATRTPRLPDEDRRWYSLGLTWNMSEHVEINASYTRIEPDSPKVGIIDAANRHTLFGDYDSNVNLFGVSGRYSF